MLKLAQVFEHSALAVGDQGFNAQHFESLVRYNERHGGNLYRIGHHRIHFGKHVGVLQVGNFTIEILPKADKSNGEEAKTKWRDALLQMLRISGLLAVKAAPEADLHLRKSPLVDLYLASFLAEVEHITHAGMVKRYRITEGNLYKLKGRIRFAQHIRRNFLHRERMFTAHQVYDRDNVFNRILKCALGIVAQIAVRPSLGLRATTSLLWFEQVADSRITAETFARLRFDRNTERYRRALQLARLIILNYSPDLRGGNENVIAILFDMNKLFERFILVQLRRAAPQFANRHLHVAGQISKQFWSSRKIRPDIVASFQDVAAVKSVVLDTKWKIPKDGHPADEDLKQMFTYNLHLGARHSLLIYPRANPTQSAKVGEYAPSSELPPGYRHSCGMCYLDLFDTTNRLRKDIGVELARHIFATSH